MHPVLALQCASFERRISLVFEVNFQSGELKSMLVSFEHSRKSKTSGNLPYSAEVLLLSFRHKGIDFAQIVYILNVSEAA